MGAWFGLGSVRGRRRWLVVLLAGLVVALAGRACWRRLARKPVPAKPAVLDPGPNALDFLPSAWPNAGARFSPLKCVFSPDRIKAPGPERLDKWKRDFPLVRPVPYPYFAGLSIPSDCCGGFLADLYYSLILISRKFGLDLPSSFWISTCRPNPAIPALFMADHRAPGHGLIQIEGDAIDRLPLLLTYYYRGWVDHLHQWSDETSAWWSLVAPKEVAPGQWWPRKVALELSHCLLTHPFAGLEVRLDASPGVSSFELELIDQHDQSHWIVHRIDLAGRAGWDVSSLPPEQLGRVYLYLDQERNRKPKACLGEINKPHLKGARVLVRGTPGATLAVRGVRLFDITRDHVQGHVEQLRSLNVLPICSTNHGSGSAWTQIDDFNFSTTYKDPVSGAEELVERPPLGATPGTPCYCADLLSDFGIIFHNQIGAHGSRPGPGVAVQPGRVPSLPSLLEPWRRVDGKPMYLARRWSFPASADYPDLTAQYEHFENLGSNIIRYLASYEDFGQHWTLYTHYNFYNGEAFLDSGPEKTARRMSEVRALHPCTEHALELLSCLKYNLDGNRKFHQRVWCCPLSVVLRFSQAQRHLATQARLEGNEVHIEPWQDEITDRQFPDPRCRAQDLHGQTFYVSDAGAARVFCGPAEITSLKRNPPDFTGRPSVTVVDTETPSIVFDEVRLEEIGGEVALENARLCYPESGAPHGRLALEIRCVEEGAAAAAWKVPRFDNHETDFLHLSYRKTNPESEVVFSWTDAEGREYTMSEGSRGGRQGWEIGRHTQSSDREVVLEYADMLPPVQGTLTIPRGRVAQFRFGLRQARAGDAVIFDRVEFLSARGLRPTADAGGRPERSSPDSPPGGGQMPPPSGLVIGGRLTGWQDGVRVVARSESRSWETTTSHRGWYVFLGVPRDTVLEISCEVAGQTCRPERGKRCQVGRNDLEYHIPTGP